MERGTLWHLQIVLHPVYGFKQDEQIPFVLLAHIGKPRADCEEFVL